MCYTLLCVALCCAPHAAAHHALLPVTHAAHYAFLQFFVHSAEPPHSVARMFSFAAQLPAVQISAALQISTSWQWSTARLPMRSLRQSCRTRPYAQDPQLT